MNADMTVRLVRYFGLLWQDLHRSKAIAADAVLPIALCNGEELWRAPRLAVRPRGHCRWMRPG